MQYSVELCSSVKQCKTKKRQPPWFSNKVKNAFSTKTQTLKRFREKPTALNKTIFLKISQKAILTVKAAKRNQFPFFFKLYGKTKRILDDAS